MENQPTPTHKSKNPFKIATIFLSVVVLGLAGLTVFQFINNTNKDGSASDLQSDTSSNTNSTSDDANNPLKSTKTYTLSDYVNIDNHHTNGTNCIGCYQGEMTKVSFNLPEKLTYDFLRRQQGNGTYSGLPYFLDDGTVFTNYATAEIKGDVLSIYSEQDYTNTLSPGGSHDYFSLLVNLDQQKMITNSELVNYFNTNLTEINKKVLTNIVAEVTAIGAIDKFQYLEDTSTITLADFEKSIGTYANYLNNRYDLYVLYIENGSLKISYSTHNILTPIGFYSHQGMGLPNQFSNSTVSL